LSFLRTNYRLTGGKANITAPKSLAEPGEVYFAPAEGGSGRLYLVFNKPTSGTYAVLVFSTALALSVGDL